MEKEIIDLQIGKRIRKNVGDLDTLKKSIQRNGLLHPIVIDNKNNLVAGLRRLKAFEELKIKAIPVSVINMDSLKGEIDENIERKDFTASEIYEIEKLVENKSGNRTDLQPLSESDRGSRRERLNKITGIGHNKRNQIKKIVESGDELLIKEADETGNIDRVARKLRRKEYKKNFKVPQLPKDKFNIIYADPPWKYDFMGTKSREIENQYQTMELEEIKDMEIPSAENAVLFLWTPAPKLKEALEVLNSWGFSYRTCAVWDKEIKGMGYWFRNQHELLLIGVKGKFSPPFEENRFSSVYKEKRKEHSKKPDFYYEMIEKMFPNSKYLELFARNKRNKWTSWGNEL